MELSDVDGHTRGEPLALHLGGGSAANTLCFMAHRHLCSSRSDTTIEDADVDVFLEYSRTYVAQYSNYTTCMSSSELASSSLSSTKPIALSSLCSALGPSSSADPHPPPTITASATPASRET